jgi:hypothetical protein
MEITANDEAYNFTEIFEKIHGNNKHHGSPGNHQRLL